MTTLRLARPWLVADLGAPHRVLSFAPCRPGFVTARRIVWREVRNADLPPHLDAHAWLADQMAAQGWAGDVAMLTARNLGSWRRVRAEVEGIAVTCIATVGMGNAEGVGHRLPARSPGPGTINIAAIVSAGLTATARIEALTIIAQARTAAVMDSGLRLPDGRRATGTGTDCIAIATPPGPGAAAHAGLHTALGEALGRAVRQAVAEGVAGWISENGCVVEGYPHSLA